MGRKSQSFLSDQEQWRYDVLKSKKTPLSEEERHELLFLEMKRDGELTLGQNLNRQVRPQEQPPLSRTRQRQLQEKVTKTKPVKKEPKERRGSCLGRLLKATFFLVFVTLIGMLIMFMKGATGIGTQPQNLQPAVTEYFEGQKTRDGINILLLGSDKRVTEESTEARTDTVMVMNVGNSSGKVKLVSFMRDTLVTIDGYSAPEGYDLKLNTAFSLGEQEGNRGAELMRQTLKTNFDLDIEYYAMIDFETFALAMDTLFPNGVMIDAQFSTVEGQVVDKVDVPDDLGENLSTGLYQTIAVGPQRMDGKTLLNYARFRGDDDGDNGRTRRQQEVIQAVASQIKDPTKLFTGSEAVGKVYSLTSTNLSFPFVLSNGLSSLTAAQEGIERLTIPEQGDWEDAYDSYGGQALLIDFEAYKNRLAELGLR